MQHSLGPIDFPTFRELAPPITDEQLRPLGSRCRCVQFSEPLSDDEFKRVAAFMSNYPHVSFRVYGHYGDGCDLEFLRHFRELRRFKVDVFKLHDLSGLRYLPDDLESLGVSGTKSKRFSLEFLARFRSLRSLYIEGHKKDIAAVSSLTSLQDLALRSITLPDLGILKTLCHLLSLDISLGGTRNLELLPRIGRIRYLELWMIRGLKDLRPVADMQFLQYLFLQSLRRVTDLPSFRNLNRLRRVHLETMKGLTDVQPVADAPALEELLAIDMAELQPEAVLPFVGHAALCRVSVGLGSLKKNNTVAEILGLPEVDRLGSGFDFVQP